MSTAKSQNRQSGATVIEYSIIAVLIYVCAFLVIKGIGTNIEENFQELASAYQTAEDNP